MKKLFLYLVFSLLVVAGFSQAKKPTIMVVPSDVWCNQHGFVTEYDNMGTKTTVPDYKKALQTDPDLLLAISKIGEMMTERGFPLKDLGSSLKALDTEAAEESVSAMDQGGIAESPIDKLRKVAKADIWMQLTWTINSVGPKKSLTFNLQGLDAYTNKAIAAASGEGNPTTATAVGVLLEEAVLNYMDNFNAALMTHFNDTGEKGREVAVEVRVWQDSPVNMAAEYEFMGEQVTLGDIVDYWMSENCVEGRFSRVGGSDNQITYKQVRIPLYKTVLGKQRAINTRGFVNGLRQFLAAEPFKIESKIIERGLGEAWLVVGAKE